MISALSVASVSLQQSSSRASMSHRRAHSMTLANSEEGTAPSSALAEKPSDVFSTYSRAEAVLVPAWLIAGLASVIGTKLSLNLGVDQILLTVLPFGLGSLLAFALPFSQKDWHLWANMDTAVMGCLLCCETVLTIQALSASTVMLVYLIKAFEPCLTALLDYISSFGPSDKKNLAISSAIAFVCLLVVSTQSTGAPVLVQCLLASVCASARILLQQSNTDRIRSLGTNGTAASMNLFALATSLLFALLRPTSALGSSFLRQNIPPLAFAVFGATTFNHLSIQFASVFSSRKQLGCRATWYLSAASAGVVRFADPVSFSGISSTLLITLLTAAAYFRSPTTAPALPASPIVSHHPQLVSAASAWKGSLLVGSFLASLAASAIFHSDSTWPHTIYSGSFGLPSYSKDLYGTSAAFDERCSGRTYNQYAWHLTEEVGALQNFGDEIGAGVVEGLLRKQGFEAPREMMKKNISSTSDRPPNRVLTIGSIAQQAGECDVLWGTGVRSFSESYVTPLIQVRAVRGPLSRQAIMHHHPRLFVPAVYGDPALLLPHIYPDWKATRLPGDTLHSRVTVIPHFRDLNNIGPSDKYSILSPVAVHWEDVVNAIINSTFVISSSLHGLIVADAFGIPSRGLLLNLEEPDFKFADYYLGTGRHNYRRVASVQEALWAGPEEPLKWDSAPLLKAFPVELF